MDSIVSQTEATRLHDIAYNIYRNEGQDAVIKYAEDIGVQEWLTCEPCEWKSPIITYEDWEKKLHKFCLVCGSGKYLEGV